MGKSVIRKKFRIYVKTAPGFWDTDNEDEKRALKGDQRAMRKQLFQLQLLAVEGRRSKSGWGMAWWILG